MTLRASIRNALFGVFATFAACAALGCIQIVQPPRTPGSDSASARAETPSESEAPAPVFGILATDAAGEPRFVETDSVPNVAGQEYGWYVWVGESEQPVKWTEFLTLPAAGSWPDSGVSPNVSISPDGRTAIVQDEAVPEEGFISTFWTVAEGDPSGEYSIVVKAGDGKEVRFAFTLTGVAASERAAPGSMADAVKACHEIQADAEIPIGCRVEYLDGAPAMFVGFRSDEEAEDYWDQMADRIAEPFCTAANSANRSAFVFVVISDEAARPYVCEVDEWGEWFDLHETGMDL